MNAEKPLGLGGGRGILRHGRPMRIIRLSTHPKTEEGSSLTVWSW